MGFFASAPQKNQARTALPQYIAAAPAAARSIPQATHKSAGRCFPRYLRPWYSHRFRGPYRLFRIHIESRPPNILFPQL